MDKNEVIQRLKKEYGIKDKSVFDLIFKDDFVIKDNNLIVGLKSRLMPFIFYDYDYEGGE